MSQETPWFHDHTTKEAKEERHHIRVWLIRIAALLIALFVVAWATKAYGQDIPLHVLEKEGVSIRLMNKPCEDGRSILMIRPEQLHRFRGLESTWPQRDGTSKDFAGCWAELTAQESGSEAGYLVVFSDGESGFIPKSEFKKVKGQVGA